jgi:sugar fermentation stimulation protein A
MAVWLSQSDSPNRKYRHTWELVEVEAKGLVGVNTGRPNAIVAEAIERGLLPQIAGPGSIRREVPYGRNSRIDLLLEGRGPPCYIEVKNTHLFRTPGLVEFPDCVTVRGRKHLVELADMARQGARAVMVYLVQAEFPRACGLAGDLDRDYVRMFVAARQAGLEAVALTCRVTTGEITAVRAIPVLDPR